MLHHGVGNVAFLPFHPVRALDLSSSIDPMDFEKQCFATVPLEDVLSPDLPTRELLKGIDRSKCRVWAFTNSYRIVWCPDPFRSVQQPNLTGPSCSTQNGSYDSRISTTNSRASRFVIIMRTISFVSLRPLPTIGSVSSCLIPYHETGLMRPSDESGYAAGRGAGPRQMPLRR